MKELKIVLLGRPITKKNSGQMMRCGNQMKHIPSKAFLPYQTSCLWQLLQYPKHIAAPVNVRAEYWMPNRQSWPDLVGLMQATADILEKGQTLENDRQIVSWDGTRIMGLDPKNPRAEIYITEVAGGVTWLT